MLPGVWKLVCFRQENSKLWECGNLAVLGRDFQGARGKRGKLAFHAFHSPAFPQFSGRGFAIGMRMLPIVSGAQKVARNPDYSSSLLSRISNLNCQPSKLINMRPNSRQVIS